MLSSQNPTPPPVADGNAEVVPDKYELNSSRASIFKSKRQRRKEVAQQDSERASDPSQPKRCKEAMDKGLAFFQEKKFAEAVQMFTLALELPGNGFYRLPESVREFRWV